MQKRLLWLQHAGQAVQPAHSGTAGSCAVLLACHIAWRSLSPRKKVPSQWNYESKTPESSQTGQTFVTLVINQKQEGGRHRKPGLKKRPQVLIGGVLFTL